MHYYCISFISILMLSRRLYIFTNFVKLILRLPSVHTVGTIMATLDGFKRKGPAL